MGFQAVFDNASRITVSNRPFVAQSITRSGVVRSVERGNAVWRFEVELPAGVPWQEEYRSVIANYTGLDRYTEDTVNFANTGYNWLFPYLGDEPNIANVRVNVINNALSIATGVTLQSGFVFRAGDLIQLVGSKVYQVTEDVAWDDTEIPVHRAPVNETVGTYDTNIGPAANFTVICVSMPNFTLVERNQVAWDGAFVFQEVLT
jgi:hypothetical protein